MGLAEDAASGARPDWIGARDLAILLLLYGAGLRVAEALSLTARVLPLGRDPGHRQARQDAGRADRAGGARGDRGLCRALPVSAGRRRAAVRRRQGRAAQRRPGAAGGARARGRGSACPTA